METNSFQMCQGTRAEGASGPAVSCCGWEAGMGWRPLQDFRIAKAAGQMPTRKLYANPCVQGDGDLRSAPAGAPGETLVAQLLSVVSLSFFFFNI